MMKFVETKTLIDKYEKNLTDSLCKPCASIKDVQSRIEGYMKAHKTQYISFTYADTTQYIYRQKRLESMTFDDIQKAIYDLGPSDIEKAHLEVTKNKKKKITSISAAILECAILSKIKEIKSRESSILNIHKYLPRTTPKESVYHVRNPDTIKDIQTWMDCKIMITKCKQEHKEKCQPLKEVYEQLEPTVCNEVVQSAHSEQLVSIKQNDGTEKILVMKPKSSSQLPSLLPPLLPPQSSALTIRDVKPTLMTILPQLCQNLSPSDFSSLCTRNVKDAIINNIQNNLSQIFSEKQKVKELKAKSVNTSKVVFRHVRKRARAN